MRLLLLFAAALASVHAQPQFFPFAIDQDAVSGAPDFSWLNQPLEPKDRLFVKEGKFFRVGADLTPFTHDDERVRLFGVNLSFDANFPTPVDATRVAKRLRRLGVNLVRFHHMDSSPDANANNARSVLLSTGPYPTFNPVAMERLKNFIAALKAEGLYTNINLHVGYQFRPAVDGIPALPAGVAFPTQSKPLHILHPRMVELQTIFTRALLSDLALPGDPALAMVEISNETALIYSWQTNALDPLLLGDYRDYALARWQDFLRARYADTGALRQAWGATIPPGDSMLSMDWANLEVHSPSQARLERLPDDIAKVTVDRAGAPVILKKVGFTIRTGEGYIAELEIRADVAAGQSRPVAWDVKQDINPWRQTTSRTVQVTSEWQRFTIPFTASLTMEGHGRYGLSVEQVGAPVYVRNVALRPAGRRGLNDTETLEGGNIDLVSAADAANEARAHDYLLYLADLDRAYLQAMLAAVREVTDPLVPVAGTQMGFGGLMTIDSHTGLDYMDEHYYIDHPNFPNVAWDDRDWRIRDTSSVSSGLSTFLNVATKRVAGMPYTVSEFNQAWPNTYAAEADVTIAAFGAFQDWDSIMHFAYSHNRNWDANVPAGFDINGDWTKWVNIGQAAWLFRSGAIDAGTDPIDIPAPPAERLRATRLRRNSAVAQYFTDTARYQPFHAFRKPVRLDPNSNEPLPEELRTTPVFPLLSSTGQLRLDRDPFVFVIQADRAAGVFGSIGSTKVTAGAIDVELREGGRPFVALLASALDDKPLTSSQRILISNPGFTLRTQPRTDPARPQLIVLYPGTRDWFTIEPDQANRPTGPRSGGIRPVWMEHVPATITLRTTAQQIVVYPLDGNGARTAPLETIERIDSGFRIALTQPTPWYEIEGN